MRHLTAKGARNGGDYTALHKPQPYINGTYVPPYQMQPLRGSIAKTTNFKP